MEGELRKRETEPAGNVQRFMCNGDLEKGGKVVREASGKLGAREGTE